MGKKHKMSPHRSSGVTHVSRDPSDCENLGASRDLKYTKRAVKPFYVK